MKENLSVKYLVYADDDQDDIEMVQEMMAEIDPSLEIITFTHGMEVIEFLRSLPLNAVLPCFIILDMNMPQYDGLYTLKAIKTDPSYTSVPVVMFSTGNEKKEVEDAMQAGAKAYVVKPVRAAELGRITKEFTEYCHELPVQTKSSDSQ